MIRSMTGFGRAQQVINGREITVEIRSVNHRYNEFSAKTPHQYRYLEEKLKTLIGKKASRGKIEASVTIHNIAGKEIKVTLNAEVVESYLKALHEFRGTLTETELTLADNFGTADVFRIPDAFTVIKSEINEDEMWDAVSQVAIEALNKFVAMREAEGAKLKDDILEKLQFIENSTAQIEEVAPEMTEKHREKLLTRMKEVIATGVDEHRVLLEAAIFAEKTAVDEETVRLKSHIAQSRELLDKEDIVGRKLDFIVQEMNREINTIGSKAHDIDITRIVVNLKSELEKIREQIQNIE